MHRTKLLVIAFFAAFAFTAFLANHNDIIEHASSFSTGPPPGFSGAPDENSCSACHGPSGSGQFQVFAPLAYVPGQTYEVRVRHQTQDITRARWGFELTALAGQSGAGTFAPRDGTTQVISDSGRSYVVQTLSGSYGGQTGSAEWIFDWTAPSTALGTVNFYASGNQANNDGTTQGDEGYTTSAVSLAGGPGLEGDVAPRNAGDGSLLANDVIQLRRFATGLDTPDPAINEFQRADDAPRTTLGDGALNAADVVQGRRYVTGLDTATAASGPTAAAARESEAVGSRLSEGSGEDIFRIGPAVLSKFGAVLVPVELASAADAAAASFTIEFDPSQLGNLEVILADRVSPSGVLTVNYASPGKIGILVDGASLFSSKAASTLVFLRSSGRMRQVPDLWITGSVAPVSIADANGQVIRASTR